MAFCTKCGRKLEEGEICHCQDNAVNQSTANSGFDPYSVKSEKSGVTQTENDVVINIDTDKIKENISGVKDNIVGALDKIGAGSSEEDGTDVYERGKLIVPECISANDGEVPIKQYNFAKLRTRFMFAKAEGRLQVTNKRVLFRATGRSIMGRTTLHEEFEINEIAGVEIRNKYDFSFLSLLGGLLLTALCGAIGVGAAILAMRANSSGAISFFEILAVIYNLLVFGLCVAATYIFAKRKSQEKFYSVRQILLAIGAGACGMYIDGSRYADGLPSEFLLFSTIFMGVCCLVNVLLISFVPDLVCLIKTKGAIPGIEIQREAQMGLLSFLFKGQLDERTGFYEVCPWKDTQIAIKELGTMIDDIQTMGDAAIEKWKN